MINALSIDVEDWYCNEFLTKYLPKEKVDQCSESVIPVLDLLKRYDVKSTFFILGTVAERHPEIIKRIFDDGHEIASHGYSHKMLSHLSTSEFENEIIKSIELLEAITGRRPEGFRAPSFSLNNSTKWALEVLVKHNFQYDASVFPIRSNLYGVPGAPVYPYRPSMRDISKEDFHGKIVEFPMSTLNIGVNIPVTGGFYFRSLPLFFQKFAITRINRTRPAMLYVHPWEMYLSTPRVKAPILSKFEAYYNINSALRKFEEMLKYFEFKPVCEVLQIRGLTGIYNN
jgi:peptidoglycan-N-acetylglucosamine deacetylase